MLFKDFSIFSSGGHFVQGNAPFRNFGRRSHKEHLYEIIFKIDTAV